MWARSEEESVWEHTLTTSAKAHGLQEPVRVMAGIATGEGHDQCVMAYTRILVPSFSESPVEYALAYGFGKSSQPLESDRRL